MASNSHPLSSSEPARPETTTSAIESQGDKAISADDSNLLIDSQPSAVILENDEIGLPKKGLEAYLQEQEKQLIITALKQTGWNKTQAAELLGTTFRSLRYRMKKLDIAEEQEE